MTKPFLARQHALASAALGLVRDPFAGELIALEPRIVFDGAALAVAVEATKQAATETPAAASDAGEHASGDHAATDASASSDATKLAAALVDSPAATAAAAAPRQIVFVDSRVPDLDAFKTSAGADALVVVVKADEDGLDAVSRTLEGMKNVDAIHIVSHGADGAFRLGKEWVTGESLKAREAELQGWAASLSADADILLYGCDIASSATGETLMAELARDTGADVAASADAVGATERGADWTLEKSTGTIEARALAPEGYGHALATTADVSLSSFSDNVEPQVATLSLARTLTNNVSLNWTNDSTPTFSGTGGVPPTATEASVIRIYWNDNGALKLVASSNVSATGAYSLTVGTFVAADQSNAALTKVSSLGDGAYKMVVKAQVGANAESVASEATSPSSTFWMNVRLPTSASILGSLASVLPNQSRDGTLISLPYRASDGVYLGATRSDAFTVTLTKAQTDAMKALSGDNQPRFQISAFVESGSTYTHVWTNVWTGNGSASGISTINGEQRAWVALYPQAPVADVGAPVTYHLYLRDLAGNYRDANGGFGTTSTPTSGGATFRFLPDPVKLATIQSVEDDQVANARVTIPSGGQGTDVNPVFTFTNLDPTYKYFIAGTRPGRGDWSDPTPLQAPAAGQTTMSLTGPYLTVDRTATGTKLPGTWSFVVVSEDSLGRRVAGPSVTYVYDPNPPTFQIVDAVGSARSEGALASGALTDGVTIKGTTQKAPGSTITVQYTVIDGAQQANGVVYNTAAPRIFSKDVIVGTDGSWTYAIPSEQLLSGLKRIEVTVTDGLSRTGSVTPQVLDGIYVTGAWTPGGLGLSGLTGWYDASLSYKNTNGVAIWSDLSGTGIDARMLSATPPSATGEGDQKVLTFNTTLNANGTINSQNGFSLPSNIALTSLVYAGDIATPTTSTLTNAIATSVLTPLRSGATNTAAFANNNFVPTGFTLSSDATKPWAVTAAGFNFANSVSGLTPTSTGNWVLGVLTKSTAPATTTFSVNGAETAATSAFGAAAYSSIGAAFTGRIGTIVTYDRTLNAAERQILNNMLSERYGTALLSTDLFRTVTGTAGTYRTDMGGIAKTVTGTTASQVSTSANGGLIVTDKTFLNSATGAASILFGNNGADGSFGKTNAAGNPGISSMARQWAVDVSGGAGGTVDVAFDVASLASTKGQTWNDVVTAFGGRKGMSLAWKATEGGNWQTIASSNSDVIVEGGKIVFSNVAVGENGLRDGFITLLDGPSIVSIVNPSTVNTRTTTFTVTTSEKIAGLTTDSFKILDRDNKFVGESVVSVNQGTALSGGQYSYDVLIDVGVGAGAISVDYDFSQVTGKDTSEDTNALNTGNAMLKTDYTAAQAFVTIDTQPPIPTITLADTTLTLTGPSGDVRETTTVTFTFDEQPLKEDGTKYLLTQSDIATVGGSVSALTQQNDLTWTATFTPDLNTSRSDASITVKKTAGYKDEKGNRIADYGPDLTRTFAVDTVRPTLTGIVRSSEAVNQKGSSVDFTVTFSEPLNMDATGGKATLSAADFVLTGPTNAALTVTPVTDAGNTQFTVRVTGLGSYNGPLTLGLRPDATLADVPLNALIASQATSTASYTIDNTRPTVLSVAPASTAINATQSATVTFSFSELLNTSGLTKDSFTVTPVTGTETSATVTSVVFTVVDGKTVATLTVAPVPGSSAQARIGLTPALFMDLAGNQVSNQPFSTITVDAAAPSVTSVARSTPATEKTNSDTLAFTVTFDEALATTSPGSVDGADFVLKDANGQNISNVTATVSGSGLSRTVSFTGAGIKDYNGRVQLALASNASITDPAGNLLTVFPAAPQSFDLDNSVAVTVDDYQSLTNIRTPTFTGASQEAATIELLNGTQVLRTISVGATSTTWSIAPTNALPYGTYALKIRATDASGNLKVFDQPITISDGLVKPTIALIDDVGTIVSTAATSGVVTDDTSPALTGSAPTGSTVSIYVAGQANAVRTINVIGSTWRYDLSDLPDGTYRYTAQVRQGALVSPLSDEFAFTVATAQPVAPAIRSALDNVGAPSVLASGDVTNDTTPTLVIDAGASAAKVAIYKTASGGTSKIGDATQDASGAWSWTPPDTAAFANGDAILTARSFSAAGVESPASAEFRLTVDSQAPTLTGVTGTGSTVLAGQSRTLTYTFSEPLAAVSPENVLISSAGARTGSVEAPRLSEDGRILTLIFTPPADLAGDTTITLSGLQDRAGNLLGGPIPGQIARSVAFDTDRPTIATSGLSVPENASAATAGRLTSNDPRATFALSSDPSGKFTVSEAGVVAAKADARFDFEAGPRSYSLEVTATDSVGNVTTETVAVSVGDVNEAPTGVRITGGQVTLGQASAVAGTLSAVDPDTTPQTFTFATSDERFEVKDGNVLQLKADTSLSASDGPKTTVDITVTDQDGLQTTAAVEILIVEPKAKPEAVAPLTPQQDARAFAPGRQPETRPAESSDPIRSVKAKLELLLNGTIGQPIFFGATERSINRLTVDLNGEIVDPTTTGSFSRSSESSVFAYSSAVRGSFIDIDLQYGSSSGASSILDPRSPLIDSVEVRPLDGVAASAVTLENGRLLVARAAGDSVRISVEIRLKTGAVLRQVITVDTRTGGIEAAKTGSGASLHGPSFDDLVASLLQGQHGHANNLTQAFI